MTWPLLYLSEHVSVTIPQRQSSPSLEQKVQHIIVKAVDYTVTAFEAILAPVDCFDHLMILALRRFSTSRVFFVPLVSLDSKRVVVRDPAAIACLSQRSFQLVVVVQSNILSRCLDIKSQRGHCTSQGLGNIFSRFFVWSHAVSHSHSFIVLSPNPRHSFFEPFLSKFKLELELPVMKYFFFVGLEYSRSS